MAILKRTAYRLFDACVIAMLIYGDENMKTFALCVAALMTVVAWVSLFGLKPEAAKVIHSTLLRRSIGVTVNFAYTYALIFSGSPIWAAFYLLGFMAARFMAASIVDKAKGEA